VGEVADQSRPKGLCVSGNTKRLMTLSKALSGSVSVDVAMSAAEALSRLEKNQDYAFLVATSDVGTAAFTAAVREKSPTISQVVLAPAAEAKTRADPNVFAILDDNTSAGDLATTIVVACENAPAPLMAAPKAVSRPVSAPVAARPEVFEVEQLLPEASQAKDAIGDQTTIAVKALARMFRMIDPQEYRTNLRYSRHVGLILRATRHRPAWPGECAALVRSLGRVTLSEGLREKVDKNQPLGGPDKLALERAAVATRTIIEGLPGAAAITEILDHVGFRFDGKGVPAGQVSRTGERIAAGARALRLAVDYDQGQRRGLIHEQVMGELRADAGRYDAHMLMAVDELETPPPPEEDGAVSVKSAELMAGAVLAEPLYGTDGNIVFKEGHALTERDVARVLALSHEHRIREHVLITRRS